MWNEGYTSEINYTSGYYSELSPTRIRLALLSCGIEHSVPEDPDYLELGFGQGFSLNVNAATNSGRYWGTDFNPGQVANARQLGNAMGKPLTLLEDSFEELAARNDLPQFDIIALHGIWSWISLGARKAIIEIARKSLKPGGALYTSYNVTPGWSPAWPLRILLSEYAKREGSGPILNKVEDSIQFVERVIGANAAYFMQNPQLANRLEQIKKHDRSYIAHEYFNAHWDPMPFSAVADQLAEAKLNFAASASILDNVQAISIPAAAIPVLQSIKDPVMRETTRDYFANTQFRRDIFIKGGRPMAVYDLNRRIESTQFMLIGKADQCPEKINTSVGEVALKTEMYKPVAEELAKLPSASATVGELMAAEGTKHLNRGQIWEIMLVLTGAGLVAPVSTSGTPKEDEAAAHSLNRALMDRAEAGVGVEFLAAPRLGTATTVSRIDQMLIRAMLNGEKDPAEAVRKSLESQGQYLIVEGQAVQDQAAALKELKRILGEFNKTRAPLLQQLGVY
ncbi:MAG: methyltransferase regulatory domain-containing protein [Novosphingobium sp.]